jgi:hypothetical protein
MFAANNQKFAFLFSVRRKQRKVAVFAYQRRPLNLTLFMSSIKKSQISWSFYLSGFCKENQRRLTSLKTLGNSEILHKKSNGNGSPSDFPQSIYHLLITKEKKSFAHCANGSLSFVCLLRKKQTNIMKRVLAGKSLFHISTSLGIEPGFLMTGSKQAVCWTSETWYECSEIAGSPQGSPLAADYVVCEVGRRTCSEHEPGTEELCEIKWDYDIVGTTA